MPETDALSYIVRNYSKISSRHSGTIEIIKLLLRHILRLFMISEATLCPAIRPNAVEEM